MQTRGLTVSEIEICPSLWWRSPTAATRAILNSYELVVKTTRDNERLGCLGPGLLSVVRDCDNEIKYSFFDEDCS